MTLKLILIGILLISLPFALVAACGRSFLYHPTRLAEEELRLLSGQSGWQLDRLPVASGLELNGLIRSPSRTDAPWLLFFGGNAMGLAAGQAILEVLAGDADWGLAVWAYRGYDGSDGRPTQIGLCSDVEVQIAHLDSAHRVKPHALVLVGQSLGSGIAAHAAAWLNDRGTPPAALVLLSPYTSIARVFDDMVPLLPVGWAVADSYPTERLVPRIIGPVLIVHGTRDTLIHMGHGEQLAAAWGEHAELHRVQGAGHNDLWNDAAALRRMRSFVLEHAARMLP
jgi:fermentation-respiration switch protein FrsA (DUF1100 family)